MPFQRGYEPTTLAVTETVTSLAEAPVATGELTSSIATKPATSTDSTLSSTFAATSDLAGEPSPTITTTVNSTTASVSADAPNHEGVTQATSLPPSPPTPSNAAPDEGQMSFTANISTSSTASATATSVLGGDSVNLASATTERSTIPQETPASVLIVATNVRGPTPTTFSPSETPTSMGTGSMEKSTTEDRSTFGVPLPSITTPPIATSEPSCLTHHDGDGNSAGSGVAVSITGSDSLESKSGITTSTSDGISTGLSEATTPLASSTKSATKQPLDSSGNSDMNRASTGPTRSATIARIVGQPSATKMPISGLAPSGSDDPKASANTGSFGNPGNDGNSGGGDTGRSGGNSGGGDAFRPKPDGSNPNASNSISRGGLSGGDIAAIVIVISVAGIIFYLRWRYSKRRHNHRAQSGWFSRRRISRISEGRLTLPHLRRSRTSYGSFGSPFDISSQPLYTEHAPHSPMVDISQEIPTAPPSVLDRHYSSVENRRLSTHSWREDDSMYSDSIRTGDNSSSPISASSPIPTSKSLTPAPSSRSSIPPPLVKSPPMAVETSPITIPSAYFRKSSIAVPPLPPLPRSPPPVPYSNPFVDTDPFEDPHPS